MATQRIRVSGGDYGPIVKWREQAEGAEFEGIFRGMRDGKFGLLADLETADGAMTLPVTTAIERDLLRVRVGAKVIVIYRGKQHSDKTGRDYHAFEVFVTNDADQLPARRQAAGAARTVFADDEVPS